MRRHFIKKIESPPKKMGKNFRFYSNIKREANFPIKYLDKAASALPNWRCKKKPFLPIKLWVIRCYKKLNYLIISNKKFPPPES